MGGDPNRHLVFVPHSIDRCSPSCSEGPSTWQPTVLSTMLPLRNRTFLPQWGAADAEIKVPSGENTERKRSPFQAWSRSV